MVKARRGFPSGSVGKESTCNEGDLGWEDPLEKEMATQSSTPAWRIPWTEEQGRLQSVGLQRVGQDWSTEHIYTYSNLHLLTPNSQSIHPPPALSPLVTTSLFSMSVSLLL